MSSRRARRSTRHCRKRCEHLQVFGASVSVLEASQETEDGLQSRQDMACLCRCPEVLRRDLHAAQMLLLCFSTSIIEGRVKGENLSEDLLDTADFVQRFSKIVGSYHIAGARQV